MSAGYSGAPLPTKLGIKDGHSVATLGAPGHFASLLSPLPGGVRPRADLRAMGFTGIEYRIQGYAYPEFCP